jgi:site-specific DNA recombinase
MRAVIYARYSSDLQRAASIADQVRDCHIYASRQSHSVIGSYEDYAISGASTLTRSGLTALLQDAKSGLFDVVIVESLDRISRNLADTAKLHDMLKFYGVEVQTISSGPVSTLQIGFMGTMNQIFLDELGKKTKRGQRGRVEAGRIPGGLSYGYNMIAGEERGKRKINAEQATIVRRIFVQYAQGHSPRVIAGQLNADGIPSPRGGQWQASTINGNVKRGNGILPNQLYIGNIVYNRQSFIKDPNTGKRVSRLNPQCEWVTHHAPELVIIEPELWKHVSTRKLGNTKRPEYYRRSRYLISGMIQCEECGGPYTVSGQNHMRCSHHRERGTCTNKNGVKIADVETRVLSALKAHLLCPQYVETFTAAYKQEWKTLGTKFNTKKAALQKTHLACEKAIASLIKTLESGLISVAITDKLYEREKELLDIETHLKKLPTDEQIPMPTDLTARWAAVLGDIQNYINAGDIAPASDELKKIVQSVTVIPKTQKAYDLVITGFLKSNIGCGSRI